MKSTQKQAKSGKMFSKVVGAFAAAAALTGLAPGEVVPDFTAPNQDGKLVRLSDFKGKPVLIYFYPKDDTPGCTKEACQFRDAFSQYQKLGATILGVSRQGAKSHQEFRAKHRLPFDLLVDEEGAIAKALGVGTMPLIGFHKRQSVLISPEGKVFKFYQDVDPATHSDEVLRDIEAMKGARR